ncbi:MAG TPA: hypothetical protein GXX55_00300 [Firmicutes bacterium]|nr:hypothetical protein [Bacillota bacterium]
MPTGIETVQYVYDALENRIKEAWTDARGVINYGYRPGNYLVQRGSTSYSWGTYGQLILKDDQPNAPGGETNYDYSARRLMTQVRVDGSPVAQFFYDPYGRRVKTVEGDTTTITLYSGNDIVYEIKTQPGQPTVTTKYLAINGKYLAKVVQEGTNPPQTYFYHVDLVGSVRAITDSQGQVVARFEYEPFGVTVQASGALTVGEVHRFTGKPEDGVIELYYFNARYYDPVTARFLQPDPARQGLNWWAYGPNNPLRFVDPDGEAFWDVLDFAFAAWSWKSFIAAPSLQTLAWALLDTAGLLPVVPSSSVLRRGFEVLDDVALRALQSMGKADVARVLKEARFKPFTEHNFRDNLSILTGRAGKEIADLEAHHVLPKVLADRFAKVGLDVNHPILGDWVKKGGYQQWSKSYQKEWEQFFRDIKNPTREKVFDYARQLARKYGFDVLF